MDKLEDKDRAIDKLEAEKDELEKEKCEMEQKYMKMEAQIKLLLQV